MQGGIKGMPVHPSAYQGMSATLAPSVLEQASDSPSKHPSTTASTPVGHYSSGPATTDTSLPPTSGLDFNFSQESKGSDFGFGPCLGSGQVTHACEGFWDHFVMDGSGEDGNETHVSGGRSNPVSVGAGPG
jgi:hypothetical protein